MARTLGKWKYAALTADERLARLRNGDKAVYDEELARSMDAVKTRENAGLDTSEQKKWIDTVSYNYNLSQAKAMGVPEAAVAKTGYADELYGTRKTSAPKEAAAPAVTTETDYKTDYPTQTAEALAGSISRAYIRAANARGTAMQNAYNDYAASLDKTFGAYKAAAVRESREALRALEEQYVNDGKRGGEAGLTARLRLREALEGQLAAYDRQKEELLGKAKTSLEQDLGTLYGETVSGIGDEYYRYNELRAKEKDAAYQKERDAVSDAQWEKEFGLASDKAAQDKEKAAADEAYRQKEFAQRVAESEADEAYRQKEFERKAAENAADEAYRQKVLAADEQHWQSEFDREYAIWQKEFSADNADRAAKLALEKEKLALEREAKEQEKSNDEKTADYYDACLKELKLAKLAVTYQPARDAYVKKYSDKDLITMIRGYDLSDKEKKALAKEIGLSLT